MGHLIRVRRHYTHHANGPCMGRKGANGIGVNHQWNIAFNELFDEFTNGVDGCVLSTQPGANQNRLASATGENTIEDWADRRDMYKVLSCLFAPSLIDIAFIDLVG